MATWFFLPLLATFMNLGLGLIYPLVRWMTLNHPQYVNMPSRRWYALNSEARLRSINPVLRLIGVLRLLLCAMWLFLVAASSLVATGVWATLPVWPLFAFIGCMLSSVVWLVVASLQGVEKEVQDSSTGL